MGKPELERVEGIFNLAAAKIEEHCEAANEWTIDRENLEGIRISTGDDGGYFMLRKSLHDPVLSMQIEAASTTIASSKVIQPILSILRRNDGLYAALDISKLEEI